jgi:hypothetical protein
MPGTLVKGHVLHDLTIAADQQMTGDLLFMDIPEVFMRLRVKLVGKQVVDPWPAKFPWRQTDAMNHEKIDGLPGWACIAVWRWVLAGNIEQAVVYPHDSRRLMLNMAAV